MRMKEKKKQNDSTNVPGRLFTSSRSFSSLLGVLLVLCVSAIDFFLFPLSDHSLFAQPAAALPTYAALLEKLPDLWKKRYPVAADRFVPNPESRGVLTALLEGRRIYYYQFTAVLPRPRRQEDGSMQNQGDRSVELWVRFRSWETEAFDLTFVRRDRLPGADFRWIKQP